jgi:hypothetical protein
MPHCCLLHRPAHRQPEPARPCAGSAGPGVPALAGPARSACAATQHGYDPAADAEAVQRARKVAAEDVVPTFAAVDVAASAAAGRNTNRVLLGTLFRAPVGVSLNRSIFFFQDGGSLRGTAVVNFLLLQSSAPGYVVSGAGGGVPE